MSERILVVHCPEPWQREALYSLCLTFAPGIRRFQATPNYPYQILGRVPGEIRGNYERGHPGWAAATGAPDPVPFGDVTLAQLRTALGLDEPEEPERITLPVLLDYYGNRIEDGGLVIACRHSDEGLRFDDLEEVDAFVDAYQAARGRGRQAGGTEEEPAQAQEVRLSNGLRLQLRGRGNRASLMAGREGGHMYYLLNLDTMPTRAARLIGACCPLSDLLPIGAQGRLIVE